MESFDVGFVMGAICGLVAGYALAYLIDGIVARLEELRRVDVDDTLERLRRLR